MASYLAHVTNRGTTSMETVPACEEKKWLPTDPGLSTGARTARQRSTLSRLTLAAVAAALVLGSLFLKKPSVFIHPEFWAEDYILRRDSQQLGAESLFAGSMPRSQQFLVQRIVAVATAGLSDSAAAAVYCWASLALTAIAAAWICLRFQPRSLALPAALAVVLVFNTGHIFGVLVNVHWSLSLLLLALLVAEDPVGRVGKALELAAVGLLSLTGPFITFWLPITVWRAWERRTAYGAALLALACLCAGFQLGGLETTQHKLRGVELPAFLNPSDPQWLTVFGSQFVGNLFAGPLFAGPLAVKPATQTMDTMLALAFVALYGWLIGAAVAQRDKLAFCFLWAGLSLVASACWAHRHSPGFLADPATMRRYDYIPFVCTAWVALRQVERRGIVRGVAAAILATMLGTSLACFGYAG